MVQSFQNRNKIYAFQSKLLRTIPDNKNSIQKTVKEPTENRPITTNSEKIDSFSRKLFEEIITAGND